MILFYFDGFTSAQESHKSLSINYYSSRKRPPPSFFYEDSSINTLETCLPLNCGKVICKDWLKSAFVKKMANFLPRKILIKEHLTFHYYTSLTSLQIGYKTDQKHGWYEYIACRNRTTSILWVKHLWEVMYGIGYLIKLGRPIYT